VGGGQHENVEPWPVRLDDETSADLGAQLRFERAGCLRVPRLLDVPEASAVAAELARVQRTEACERAALRHELRVHFGAKAASRCLSLEDCRAKLHPLERLGKVKFLQYFNLHRLSGALLRAALSPRLGLWASRLLGVPRVRLYQDALFMKKPGHGPTRWHSDLGLTPLDTNDFVTAWVALTPVPASGGSGLRFACGSHRDYALQYHRELEGVYNQESLSGRYDIEEGCELSPGDATFHHGWTLHAAAALAHDAPGPRVAWALSYMADGAKLLPREAVEVAGACEDAVSFEPWVDEVRPGEALAHPLLPLVPAR